ncbi:MAG: SDR family oxidoreductase [Lewinella sp.]|nr:SDR family oxidoreductase [Lewinella sp.]
MQEKKVLITGGNAGIGRAAAMQVARAGHTVILAGRDPRKLEAAASCIRYRTGNKEIHTLELDLASLPSVALAAMHFQERFDELDVLINNAGIFSNELLFSDDGYELQFAINHLGHFALTHHLLPSLWAAPRARVINLTSVAHYQGGIDFDNLKGEKGPKAYHGLTAYAQSKLANVLFTREMARRHPELITNCLHPGVTRTRIGNKHSHWHYALFWELYKPFMRSPHRAARGLQYLAFSPELNDVSGRYFDEKQCCRKPSLAARDEQLARELWQTSQAYAQIPS